MTTKSDIGFVAITNHVLDAAKSNRCVCLLRSEPDADELRAIASGCLFDDNLLSSRSLIRGLPKQIDVTVEDLVDGLCSAYAELLNDQGEFAWFETRYGLRDFIHTVKLLKRMAVASQSPEVTLAMVCNVLERNFNGVKTEHFLSVVRKFIQTSFGENVANLVMQSGHLRDPIDVVQDALADIVSSQGVLDENAPRYKLILDSSNDDSMMRLLDSQGLVQSHSGVEVFKLSDFIEDHEIQKVLPHVRAL
jgi:hemicentin